MGTADHGVVATVATIAVVWRVVVSRVGVVVRDFDGVIHFALLLADITVAIEVVDGWGVVHDDQVF